LPPENFVTSISPRLAVTAIAALLSFGGFMTRSSTARADVVTYDFSNASITWQSQYLGDLAAGPGESPSTDGFFILNTATNVVNTTDASGNTLLWGGIFIYPTGSFDPATDALTIYWQVDNGVPGDEWVLRFSTNLDVAGPSDLLSAYGYGFLQGNALSVTGGVIVGADQSAVIVPEPAGFASLGVAIGALGLTRRRRA